MIIDLKKMSVEKLRELFRNCSTFELELGILDELARRLRAAERKCPEGWVCVPREPTTGMSYTFESASGIHIQALSFLSGYKAMLAAVPKETGD
jgi:hypothetical protein